MRRHVPGGRTGRAYPPSGALDSPEGSDNKAEAPRRFAGLSLSRSRVHSKRHPAA